jgi:hypothetical protein
MKRRLPVFGLAVLAAAIPVYAHHSFAAHYFEDQSITVQGVLVEFEYKSPHVWVHLDVKDEAGQTQRVSAEWANPNRLGQQRITKDSLKVGDVLTIVGSPGRNASERKMHLKGIERPADGWNWRGRAAPRS